MERNVLEVVAGGWETKITLVREYVRGMV